MALASAAVFALTAGMHLAGTPAPAFRDSRQQAESSFALSEYASLKQAVSRAQAAVPHSVPVPAQSPPADVSALQADNAPPSPSPSPSPAASSTPAPQPSSSAPAPSPAPQPSGSEQQQAMQILDGDGWGGQFSCLNSIIMQESSWNVYATNPSSGAYGIPQALPGSKMAAAGSDWQTSSWTQLEWMINYYIKPVYGTPCNAWAFWQAHGAY